MKLRALATGLAALAILLAVTAEHVRRRAATAEADSARLRQELAATTAQLAQSREQAAKLESALAELDGQLGAAKVRGTASEARRVEHDRDLTAVRQDLAERRQREASLLAELESLRRTPAAAGDEAGAAAMRGRIADLESQLAVLLARTLAEPSPTAAASAPPSHQVVRVGGDGAFVVLDYGATHGASPGQTAVLSRGTSTVARVQISDVRSRHSVARVLPDTRKGQLQPGDIVLLAR